MSNNSLKLVVLLAAAAGFGFDEGGCDACNPKPTPATCSPACGAGYTCQNGTCVGSCTASSCASGACLNPTTCAQCTLDAHCSGSTPRCSANHCVACVPGASDNCSSGNYCDGATNTCTKGCKANSECASNSCNPTSHDCSACVNDGECSLGKVCNAGTCEAPCSSNAQCSGGKLCCGSKCTSQYQDTGCHACNITCTASQFCGASACVNMRFEQLCELDAVTVIHDGDAVDNTAGDAVGAAFSTVCGRSIAASAVDQTNAAVVDQATGQPKPAPGKFLILAGGSFVHNVVRYLVESPGLSKVFDTYADNGVDYVIRRRSDNALLMTIDPSTLSAGHDYFVVEMIKEPTTKAVSLAFYGMDAPGTRAAAWYLANQAMPMRASFMGTYYIVEWTDQNGDETPNGADMFTIHLHD